MDAPTGMTSDVWELVWPSIAKFTRVKQISCSILHYIFEMEIGGNNLGVNISISEMNTV